MILEKWIEKIATRVYLEQRDKEAFDGVSAGVSKLTRIAFDGIERAKYTPCVSVQLDDGAYMPLRAHDTDAGADIFCKEAFTVPAHNSVMIDTGVHIQLPPHTKAELVSKSGLNINHCITTTGLIDEGYSGKIMVRVYNHGDYDYTFEAGDKVTQLVITDVMYATFTKVESVEGGERGDGGFGSTGRK